MKAHFEFLSFQNGQNHWGKTNEFSINLKYDDGLPPPKVKIVSDRR
jgi:hypothetical protein